MPLCTPSILNGPQSFFNIFGHFSHGLNPRFAVTGGAECPAAEK
jgi:hypothetical protein